MEQQKGLAILNACHKKIMTIITNAKLSKFHLNPDFALNNLKSRFKLSQNSLILLSAIMDQIIVNSFYRN
ncbi:unnamed protein product [Paramecium octaurelia]|uniref:Uncharacterized protein n=1 Tax=Paramecium octaurelia TaxID=43137 RepID=A0A8S1VQF6_PAROT|nr:unnamed protein product [Paramecium octaurelia]